MSDDYKRNAPRQVSGRPNVVDPSIFDKLRNKNKIVDGSSIVAGSYAEQEHHEPHDIQTRCVNVIVSLSRKLGVDVESLVSELEVIVAPTEVELKLNAERQILLKRKKDAEIEKVAGERKISVDSLRREVDELESSNKSAKAEQRIEYLANKRKEQAEVDKARAKKRKEDEDRYLKKKAEIERLTEETRRRRNEKESKKRKEIEKITKERNERNERDKKSLQEAFSDVMSNLPKDEPVKYSVESVLEAEKKKKKMIKKTSERNKGGPSWME